jgi:hypothetical protein
LAHFHAREWYVHVASSSGSPLPRGADLGSMGHKSTVPIRRWSGMPEI